MSPGVESYQTVTGTAPSGDERQHASDGALGTPAVTVENELKSRIGPRPRNGQLHRTRLRFGSHLESDQGALIPENAADTHCVAVFERPREAESAIRELEGAGFDMKRLSLVGRDYDAGGRNAARDELKDPLLERAGSDRGGTNARAGVQSSFRHTQEPANGSTTPEISRVRRIPYRSLPEYQPGTWGPTEADRLIAGSGGWRKPAPADPRTAQAH